jgi:outer membrane autotransporter protein
LDVLRVGPYLSLMHDRWFIDVSATYGYHDNSVRRRVTAGAVAEVAEGWYHANDFSLYLGLGSLLGELPRVVSPVASVQYLYFDRPGFVEKGAPAAGLTLGSRASNSLRSRLGLEASHIAALGCFQIETELSAGWAHEYLNNEGLPARFTAGSTSFTTRRLSGNRDTGYFGAGITVDRGKRLAVSCRYTGELSEKGSFHGVDAGLTTRY